MSAAALKAFFRTWVVPPGFLGLYRSSVQVPQTYQKFWAGQPQPAPRAESSYFAAIGLEASTRTLRDDTRSCAPLSGRMSLPLALSPEADCVQFALATESASNIADVRLRIDDGPVTVHSGLSDGAWLDVRMTCPAGSQQLHVESSGSLCVTMPRGVRTTPPTASRGVRHVLLLVLDGWSERMFAPGHPTEPGTPLTPNIDRFFANGLHAPRAISSAEWTLPTVASIFTGLMTSRHRHYKPMDESHLPQERELLAERFQRAGYHTLALSPANRITPAFGHHRGFDRFVYHWPGPGHTQVDYDPAVWTNDVLGHLDTHRNDLTFTYMHLPDTHPAWHIPPATRAFNLQRRGSSTGFDLERLDRIPASGEQGRQLHLIRLHELDRMLGGLFRYVEDYLDDQTIVVLTSDHGTPWHHVRETRPADEPYLVDDRTSILFRMRGPGVPAKAVEGLVAPNLDLMPTVLTLAGLDPPSDLDGADLTRADYRRDHVVSESLYKGVYEIAVRDGERAYIEKYRFDENAFRVSGGPTYAKLFKQGTPDYSTTLDDDPGRLRALAHAHMQRMGVIDGAAA